MPIFNKKLAKKERENWDKPFLRLNCKIKVEKELAVQQTWRGTFWKAGLRVFLQLSLCCSTALF